MSSPYNLRGNDVYDYGSEHTLDRRPYRRRRDLFAASNQAKADIRPNAPVPVELKSGIFAYMFGQPKFQYSESRNVPKQEEANDIVHSDVNAARNAIDSFEESTLKLEPESGHLADIIRDIRDPEYDHVSDPTIPDQYKRSDLEFVRDDLLSDTFPSTPYATAPSETEDQPIERHSTEEELDTIPDTPLPTLEEVENQDDNSEQPDNSDWASSYSIAARLAQQNKDLIDGFISEIKSPNYLNEKANFLKEIGYVRPDPEISFADYTEAETEYLKKILQARDTKFEKPRTFVRFPVIYIPSGGGKTTMKRNSIRQEIYFDQDELVFQRYDQFSLVQSFVESQDLNLDVIEAWFRYEFHINYDSVVRDKILLVSNPRMLPYYHRNHFNELVIIPARCLWDLRFFRKDFFSLLALNSKPKLLSDYEYYEDVILHCFDKYLSAVDVYT